MKDPCRLSDPLDRLFFGPFVPIFDPFRLWTHRRDPSFRLYLYPDPDPDPELNPDPDVTFSISDPDFNLT